MTRVRRLAMGMGGPAGVIGGLLNGRTRSQAAVAARQSEHALAEPPADLKRRCPCGVITAAGPLCRKCKPKGGAK